MASPQKENGHTQIANEILEKLVASGLNGTELAVVFFVIRKTYGFNKKDDEISLSQFLNAIPVSRQTLCSALKNLQLVKILRLVKRGTSLNSSNKWAFNKDYDTWQLVKKSRLVKKSLHQLVKFSRHTKDNIQKKDIISTSVSNETNDDIPPKELVYVSDLEEYKKPKRATRQKPENRKLSMKLIDHLKHIKKMTVPDGRFEEDNIYPCASLVNKMKATLLTEKKEQTDEEILKLFDYIMNKLSDWHWERATSIKYISNNYYRIYEEIKNNGK